MCIHTSTEWDFHYWLVFFGLLLIEAKRLRAACAWVGFVY